MYKNSMNLFVLILAWMPAHLACMESSKSPTWAIHKASGLPLVSATIGTSDIPSLIPILDQVKKRMDDWPELQKYKEANEEEIKFKDDKVVFLGDSITEYWGKPEYGNFFEKGHPSKKYELSYVNRGICGQTTAQMLLRMRADVINLKPSILVLHGGANDIAGNTGPMSFSQTVDALESMSELAKQNCITVLCASLLPTSDYHFDGKDPRGPQTVRRPLGKIRKINKWLEHYCIKTPNIYLDYYSAMVDESGMLKRELSDDDLHPNAAGYKVMERLAHDAIEKEFKQDDQDSQEEEPQQAQPSYPYRRGIIT